MRSPDDTDPPPRTGTVTDITVQRRDPSRRSVFVDGEFAYGLHADLIVQYRLVKGSVIDEPLAAALLREQALAQARQWALNQLAYRARSTFEIRRFLQRKGVEESVIAAVIDQFVELGRLDDEAFALGYAESARGARNLGPRRIVAELRKRGIERELAERAGTGGPDQSEAAQRHAELYVHRLSGESDPGKRHRKLYAHLARRGFDPDTIHDVIRSVLNDTDGA